MRRAASAALTILLAGAACTVSREPAALAANGERAYRQCHTCHSLEQGRNTPAGPTLHAIVGRPIASVPSFDYSPALRRFAARNRRWTPALLDRFLADPETVVPGTEMGYVGMDDPAARRALIAWLRVVRAGSTPAAGAGDQL